MSSSRARATPEIAAMTARAEAAEARFNARAATREAAVAQRLGRPAAPKTMAQPEGPAQEGAWGDTSSDTVMADLCREACKNLYADQEVEKEAKNAAEPAGVLGRACINEAVPPAPGQDTDPDTPVLPISRFRPPPQPPNAPLMPLHRGCDGMPLPQRRRKSQFQARRRSINAAAAATAWEDVLMPKASDNQEADSTDHKPLFTSVRMQPCVAAGVDAAPELDGGSNVVAATAADGNSSGVSGKSGDGSGGRGEVGWWSGAALAVVALMVGVYKAAGKKR